jgi:Family of unknown function (DUF6223)
MLWPKKPVRVSRASLFYRVADESKHSRGHRLPNPPLCDHSHRSADLSRTGSHVTFRSPIPSHRWRLAVSMKRTFAIILAAVAAAALFGGLVHAVLVAAHVSEPAASTVYGLTPRRLWATTVAVLALAGVVIGGLALARPASRFGTASGRLGAIVALVAGLIAVVNGGLNVAIANGGPGSGNGVVGGAAAFVLGLIGLAIGGLALARSRRIA